MDFNNFKFLDKGNYAMAMLHDCIRINKNSISLGSKAMKDLSEGSPSFYVAFRYSEIDKALLLEKSNKEHGFRFEVTNPSCASRPGLPLLFRKEDVPIGDYIAHPTVKNVYIYDSERRGGSTTDRLQLLEFEEPETGDIVHFTFKIGASGPRAIGTAVIEEVNNKRGIKIRPISKNYLDSYPGMTRTYRPKESLLIREKHHAQ